MLNTGKLSALWAESRQLIKEGNFEEAEQKLDMGILILAQASMDGLGDKDLYDGVKMETWKERFWIETEKHIWPLKKDI